MIVEFTTTFAISALHHWCCEFESRSGEVYSLQHYMIQFVSDLHKVSGTPVSSTIKIVHRDVTEILLKMALNTITVIPLFPFW